MSSGLEGHRFPTFLSSPDSPQGSWALQSSVGETMGVLYSALLKFDTHLLCNSWRSAVPLSGLSSLFMKQRFGQNRSWEAFLSFFFFLFFCMTANWGKTKWGQVLGNVSSFSNSKCKWHLENQKLHRRCLTLSLWSSSLTYMWGLECAWYCAMCWTCLRWFGEALWRHLYPYFRDENIEACRG